MQQRRNGTEEYIVQYNDDDEEDLNFDEEEEANYVDVDMGETWNQPNHQ